MNQTTTEKQIIKKRAIEDIAMWGRILSGFACLLFILTAVITCSIFIMPFAELQEGEMVALIITLTGVTLITSPAIRIHKTVLMAHKDLNAPEAAKEEEYVQKMPRILKWVAQLGSKQEEDKALLVLVHYGNILRYVGFTSAAVIGVFSTFILFMRFIRPIFL